jgi:molecular chaperone HtpG
MKEGQERIYYVTAETFLAAKNSPHLEIFRKRGIEVLLLSERVDDWLVANLAEHEGKPLASVAKGELDLSKLQTDDEKKEEARQASEHRALVGKLKDALGDKVKEVRVSSRLTQSPSCLVADEHDMGGNLARILKAVGQKGPEARPILEINPAHPMVKRLEEEKARFADWSNLLFDQALLAEGGQLDDPAGFVRRMNELMLEMAGEGGRIIVPGR